MNTLLIGLVLTTWYFGYHHRIAQGWPSGAALRSLLVAMLCSVVLGPHYLWLAWRARL